MSSMRAINSRKGEMQISRHNLILLFVFIFYFLGCVKMRESQKSLSDGDGCRRLKLPHNWQNLLRKQQVIISACSQSFFNFYSNIQLNSAVWNLNSATTRADVFLIEGSRKTSTTAAAPAVDFNCRRVSRVWTLLHAEVMMFPQPQVSNFSFSFFFQFIVKKKKKRCAACLHQH